MTTFTVIDTMAQAPGNINYQAVARNTITGMEVANQPIFISIKILENGPSGSIVYQENHDNVETNSYGLFNISIGAGEAINGDFQDIEWANGSYWLELDLDAGNGLETLGSMQFVSVPYALHAETVTNSDDADADPSNELVTDFTFDETTGTLSLEQAEGTFTQNLNSLIDDDDADPTNELVSEFTFDETSGNLILEQANGTFTQNLNSLIDDADADPANELVSDFTFDESTGNLSLEQANGTLTQNLNSLIDDADADPANELVSSFYFDSSSSQINLVQQGDTLSEDLSSLQEDADSDPTNEAITSVLLQGTTLKIEEVGIFSVNLNQLVDDDDADPSNELITSMELVNDTIFKIYEGTNESEIDFGSLKRDADWRISETGETISNYGTRVGIGTTDPKSTFQVNGSVGYDTKILTNGFGAVNYSVTGTDHIIVCTVSLPASNNINITMPIAANCKGRVITVRKTGLTPIIADVKINFGSDLLDFEDQDYLMNNFQRETATFISLGAAGWSIIYTD